MSVLCYNGRALKKSSSKISSRNCSICGSSLILVEETTAIMGNNLYPITKTIFHCSNQNCQNAMDEKVAKNAQFRKDQAEAKQKRMDALKVVAAATAAAKA